MEVNLQYLIDKKSTLAKSNTGHELTVTPSKEKPTFGMTPMELVLVALASCSTPEIVSILQKQKQDLQSLSIAVKAKRADSVPAVFTEIHLRYTLEGKLDEQKVKKAIVLSLEKYCSVAAMLQSTATITHSFSINNVE